MGVARCGDVGGLGWTVGVRRGHLVPTPPNRRSQPLRLLRRYLLDTGRSLPVESWPEGRLDTRDGCPTVTPRRPDVGSRTTLHHGPPVVFDPFLDTSLLVGSLYVEQPLDVGDLALSLGRSPVREVTSLFLLKTVCLWIPEGSEPSGSRSVGV